MPTSAGIIPFTELFERTQEQVRDSNTDSSVETKYMGRINDIYQRDLPLRKDFDFLEGASTVTLNADYTTGTVAVAVAGTDITGTDTVWVTGMSDRKIIFSGNDDVYTFTWVSETTATISPAYTGSTALTESTYKIVDYDYSMPSDFTDSEVLLIYYWQNGARHYLHRALDSWWETNHTTNPGTPDKYRIFGEDDDGYSVLELNCPPDESLILHLEYEKILSALTEYTATCKVTNDDETVTGTSTYFTTNVAAGDYFRMDANGTKAESKWYKVDSVTSNTELELTAVWGEATVSTAAAFTICKAPAIPYYLHDALIWGACMISAMAQGEKVQSAEYATLYLNRIGQGMRRKDRKITGKRLRTIYERRGTRR